MNLTNDIKQDSLKQKRNLCKFREKGKEENQKDDDGFFDVKAFGLPGSCWLPYLPHCFPGKGEKVTKITRKCSSVQSVRGVVVTQMLRHIDD